MVIKLWKANKSKSVRHPVFAGVEPQTEEELQEVYERIDQPGAREELLLKLMSLVRYTTGLYLAKWGCLENEEDDIISVGLLAMTEFANSVNDEVLGGRPLLLVAGQRMKDAVDRYVNANKTIVAPSLSTQVRHANTSILKRHLNDVRDVGEVADTDLPFDAGDEDKRDLLDALDSIAKDEIDRAIIERANWGRSNKEIAEDLGVNRATIYRRRSQLYDRYLNLTR
ncbi:MAG: hypothetical protein DRH04_07310 [Deltaproteobacteria bacterium]|nr:MAG: hypothetical protein DRH04_07310 [Deltaproteobacteria bacterium]